MVDIALLDTAVSACEQRPGVPTNVDTDKWPIQLLTVPSSSGVSFCGRRILIVCSTLGNWAPPVPLCIQQNYVVVLVKNCAQGRHYGFRSCLYVNGQSESWEALETDLEAVSRVWSVLHYLVDELDCLPRLSFISMSAGVDQALSILIGNPRTLPFAVDYFVAVCGAWHPELYNLVEPIFIAGNVYVIVQHHGEDKLCPWPKVGEFWHHFKSRVVESRKASLYLNLLYIKDSQTIDKNRHDIGKFLFGQDNFWELLLTDKEIYVGICGEPLSLKCFPNLKSSETLFLEI